MNYFVLYVVDSPRSLLHGLHVEERPTYDEALVFAREAIAKRCSGVRLIQGTELAIVDETGEPFRQVVFNSSK